MAVKKKPVVKKPAAKKRSKPMLAKQPDDPGIEKLDLEQFKTSWEATPDWVKGALLVSVLIAVLGFLF